MFTGHVYTGSVYGAVVLSAWTRSGATSVDVDDGVGEQVAARLHSVDIGAGTADRASPTDAVPADRQSAVAQNRRRVVRRQLQTGVTVSLTHRPCTRRCTGKSQIPLR